MKNQFIKLIIILFIISNSLFAQTLTPDEISRVKFSVHLITYDTINNFESAIGEAYYNIIINSFIENLSIPQFSLSNLTIHDDMEIDKFIKQLNNVKQHPPTWEELLIKQTQYLIWLDKVTRRQTKYKHKL